MVMPKITAATVRHNIQAASGCTRISRRRGKTMDRLISNVAVVYEMGS